ncbi:hypothetical protein H8A99_36965 [Bradyrhizobium sp. Arg68]|uniref:hypothetical protein n=1 Tax=Bradyrhizobium ivorense TaxID=2511166 RepID=UPI001E53BEC5|nr:hypothetical protein [Bradyrhizobium ivorense]MCC8941872.1 hypothetical protein [Bradyrhizobium ivorense]
MTAITNFPILPTSDDLSVAFHQRGAARPADSIVTYGPLTSLFSPLSGRRYLPFGRVATCFRLARARADILRYLRSWRSMLGTVALGSAGARSIDKRVAGVDGTANRSVNLRWIGSLGAEGYRILTRGSVFLFPSRGWPKVWRRTREVHPDDIHPGAGRRVRPGRREHILDPGRAQSAPARADDYGVEP